MPAEAQAKLFKSLMDFVATSLSAAEVPTFPNLDILKSSQQTEIEAGLKKKEEVFFVYVFLFWGVWGLLWFFFCNGLN